MWDLKYRPLVFSDVLGQEGTSQVLQARLRENKAFDTSYIFAGGHGCGKTTLSRILARAMLCQNLREDGNPCNECSNCKACLDETMVAFTEMDAASHGTTADMRSLVEDLAFAIPGVPKRIYLLDEAHRMSRDAQDVLLKPIEDKRLVVIFCTTELPKIRGTIGSRCEVYEIRKINRDMIFQRMQAILDQEGVVYDKEAVLTVIDLAKGHVRDTLKKLERVAQLGPITVEAVHEQLNLSVVSTYYDILLSLADPPKAVALVEEACDRVGPADVTSGLAEAAMNSYRQAHKMYADYAALDPQRAARVYELYGDTLIGLARYFLRSSFPSKLNLICDTVELCGSGGQVVPQAAPVMAPPVRVVAAAAPALVTQEAPKATSVSVLEAQAPEETEEEAPPPTTPTAQQAPPPEKPPPSEPTKDARGVRPDGIGPLGSSDVGARTSLDHLAVPSDYPRGHDRRQATVRRPGKSGRDPSESLTGPQFTMLLNKLRGLNRPNA